MPNQNQTSKPIPNNLPPTADSNVVPPQKLDDKDSTKSPTNANEIMRDVVDKVRNVHNILIALSSDPSVDEISAAIGLSLCLDRIGKRATSIYSGKTPNALEFLNPSKTFETSSDVLRDFVIALDKDKADHLRYKLDDKYVKIFITPYKSRIDEEDLEFSLGDFNIELVLALNVSSGIDLDDALREHGRVMHDATVVNITNGNPGKFGDIEWSDKTRSSICEMAATMLYELGGKNALEPDEATALLTGIVSATDHFSNNSTTADALQIGAKLMNSGADRKLISENISLDSDNMLFMGSTRGLNDESESVKINHDDDKEDSPKPDSLDSQDSDSTSLSDLKAAAEDLINAENSTPKSLDSIADAPSTPPATATEPAPVTPQPTAPTASSAEEQPPIPEPSATPSATFEPSIATETLAANQPTEPIASPTSTSVASNSPSDFVLPSMPIESPELTQLSAAPSADADAISPMPPTPAPDSLQSSATPGFAAEEVAATTSFLTDEPSVGTNKYSKMLDEALAESGTTPEISTPEPLVTPEFDTVPEFNTAPLVSPTTAPVDTPTATPVAAPSQSEIPTPPIFNPAISAAPTVAFEPEINGVPEINYNPIEDNILPPPPAPPIDFNSPMPTPSTTQPAI